MRRKTLFGQLLESKIEFAIMKNVIQHAFKKGSLDESVQIAGSANGSCFF